MCFKKKKIKLSLDKVENLFHVSAFLLCHVLFQNWKMTFLKWKLVLVLQETWPVVCSNLQQSWKWLIKSSSLDTFSSFKKKDFSFDVDRLLSLSWICYNIASVLGFRHKTGGNLAPPSGMEPIPAASGGEVLTNFRTPREVPPSFF